MVQEADSALWNLSNRHCWLRSSTGNDWKLLLLAIRLWNEFCGVSQQASLSQTVITHGHSLNQPQQWMQQLNGHRYWDTSSVVLLLEQKQALAGKLLKTCNEKDAATLFLWWRSLTLSTCTLGIYLRQCQMKEKCHCQDMLPWHTWLPKTGKRLCELNNCKKSTLEKKENAFNVEKSNFSSKFFIS